MKKIKIILIVLATIFTLTIQPFKAAVKFDFNNDELITDQDAIYLLMYTFFPEEYPISGNCDINNDGTVNDADAIYLLMSTFFPDDYPLSHNFVINNITYEPVEYIEADGSNYIDIGLSCDNNLSGELTFLELPTSGTLFGSFGQKYSFTINGSDYEYNANPSLKISNTIEQAETYVIKFSNSNLSINDVVGNNQTSSDLTPKGTFKIFAGNNQTSTGKFVGGKIYANGKLVRDLVPVVKEGTNEYGVVDSIHNKYYKLSTSNEQTDAFLFEDNKVFNPELAMYLLNIQMKAYDSSFSNLLEIEDVDDYPIQDGYNLISSWRETNESAPTKNASAYNLYSKSVIIEDETYNLYILNVLSTQNQADWESNLDIGNSTLHSGCEKTADFIISSISSNITDDPTHNKIMLVGNARGAAVGAIIASKLTNSAKFSKDNVYGYTFGCPNYAKDSTTTYANIFAINNPGDPLGILPLTQWGYSSEATHINLSVDENTLNKMKELYIEYQIVTNNIDSTPETYDETLYEEFAGMTDLTELVNYVYAAFPNDNFLKNQNNINFVLSILDVAFNNPESLDPSTLISQVSSLSSYPRAMRDLIFYLTEEPSRFAYAHKLSVYKAWLSAQYNIE